MPSRLTLERLLPKGVSKEDTIPNTRFFADLPGVIQDRHNPDLLRWKGRFYRQGAEGNISYVIRDKFITELEVAIPSRTEIWIIEEGIHGLINIDNRYLRIRSSIFTESTLTDIVVDQLTKPITFSLPKLTLALKNNTSLTPISLIDSPKKMPERMFSEIDIKRSFVNGEDDPEGVKGFRMLKAGLESICNFKSALLHAMPDRISS